MQCSERNRVYGLEKWVCVWTRETSGVPSMASHVPPCHLSFLTPGCSLGGVSRGSADRSLSYEQSSERGQADWGHLQVTDASGICDRARGHCFPIVAGPSGAAPLGSLLLGGGQPPDPLWPIRVGGREAGPSLR